MNELKSCPRCSCTTINIISPNYEMQDYSAKPIASCNNCGAKSDLEQWNTRAPQSEWISVDDEFPETDQHIIMCNEHGDRFSGRGSVLIQTNLSPEPYIGRRSRYTHWMTMPPPPKGK